MGLIMDLVRGFLGSRYIPPPPMPALPGFVNPGPGNGGGDTNELLRLVNTLRGYPKPLLVRDAKLDAWAQGWARQMELSHTLSHSTGIGAGLHALGYDWFSYAENVAGPWSDGRPTSALECFGLWERSPPHNANMTSGIYAEAGIGFSGGYWCMTFGRRS